MCENHLSVELDDNRGYYYCDSETGCFIGERGGSFSQNNSPYYIKVSDVIHTCDKCGYTGQRYHPEKDSPTRYSVKEKICPKVDCNGRMKPKD